jgi:hypothetical protein
MMDLLRQNDLSHPPLSLLVFLLGRRFLSNCEDWKIRFLRTFAHIYQNLRYHIPKGNRLLNICHENIKSYRSNTLFNFWWWVFGIQCFICKTWEIKVIVVVLTTTALRKTHTHPKHYRRTCGQPRKRIHIPTVRKYVRHRTHVHI